MTVTIDLINESNQVIEPLVLDQIKRSIEVVLSSEQVVKPCEISFLIVDNAEIRGLNAQFRHMDKATDVLSFPQYEPFSAQTSKDPYLYLGDVVISAEQAAEQAKTFGHSFEREMVYLTVHSIFHLLGYDHLTDADKAVMRAKEKMVLKTLGIFKEV